MPQITMEDTIFPVNFSENIEYKVKNSVFFDGNSSTLEVVTFLDSGTPDFKIQNVEV